MADDDLEALAELVEDVAASRIYGEVVGAFYMGVLSQTKDAVTAKSLTETYLYADQQRGEA